MTGAVDVEGRPRESTEAAVDYATEDYFQAIGIPLLDGTLAEVACNVVAEHPAGDHTIFLGEVESMEYHEGDPLLFHRGQYRRLAP